MISGDIYDKSVPSAEAVTLFDEFLSRLAQLQVKVYAISGNHDSPEIFSRLTTRLAGCIPVIKAHCTFKKRVARKRHLRWCYSTFFLRLGSLV